MGPYIISALLMMLLDIVTGVIKALRDQSLSSVKAREGLYNKCGYLIVMGVAGVCEYATGTMDMDISIPLMGPACIYIFVTELISILENVTKINPKILKFAARYLAGLKDSEETDANESKNVECYESENQ